MGELGAEGGPSVVEKEIEKQRVQSRPVPPEARAVMTRRRRISGVVVVVAAALSGNYEYGQWCGA